MNDPSILLALCMAVAIFVGLAINEIWQAKACDWGRHKWSPWGYYGDPEQRYCFRCGKYQTLDLD